MGGKSKQRCPDLQPLAAAATARPLTVEPPGVVLLRPDGRPASHGPEQSRVCAHEVDVDASVQVPVWKAQVPMFV